MAKDYLKSVLGIFDNAKELAKRKAEEARRKAQEAARRKAQQAKSFVRSVPQKLKDFNEITVDERNAGRNYLISKGFKSNKPAATKGIKITDAIKDTSKTVANDFGNFFRNSGFGGKKLQPVMNMVGNTAETVGSGVSGGTMNVMNLAERPTLKNFVRQGAGLAYNVAKPVAAATPFFTGANIASQVPQGGKLDVVPRISAGLMRGATGVKELAPDVEERKTMKLFGEEFDPATAGGEMLGFVKNPVNKKIFSATEKIAPKWFLASKNSPAAKQALGRIKNFIAKNSVRGSIEDILMSLDELPEGAGVKEQALHLVKNGLIGAASENVGQGFFKGTELTGKQLTDAAQKGLNNVDFKPVVDFLEEVNVLRKIGGEAPKAEARGPRKAEDIIRDAQGRFSVKGAEPQMSKVEQLARDPSTKLADLSASMRKKVNEFRFTEMGIHAGSGPRAKSRLAQTPAYGFAGGVETEVDEDGKVSVNYSPEKGMAGFFAAGAIQNKGGRNILKGVTEAISKNIDDIKIHNTADEVKAPDDLIASAREQISKIPNKPEVSWKEAADRFYTDWVDRFHPIEKVAAAVEKGLKEKGASLRPEHNPKYQIRRFLGVGGIAESKFQENVAPVLKQLDEQGIDKIDMDAYLKARRDAGFGEVGRDIIGSDPVQAKATIEAFESKYGAEKLQSVASQLYDHQNKLFDELVDAGFMKRDVAERIRAANPDYVPFERVMDDEAVDEFLGIPTKKVVQGSSPVDKSIEGSTKDIYSPIESIIANTYKYTAAIEKNKVAQTVARLQEVMPEIGFTPAAKSGAGTIPVWIDGAKQHINVGTDIADAAKGLNEESMNNVLKVLQFPAIVLRSGATGQNPEFMLPNVLRDQFEAGLFSNHGYIPFVDYFKGLYHIMRKDITGSDEVVDRWLKSGASQDLTSMSGRKNIEEFFSSKTKRKTIFGYMGDVLDFMGRYSEQPTRVGLFDKAYKKTGNERLAMFESRDATLDFSRMGSKMKVANSLVPFLNVGIQGFDKLVRQLKTKPAKTMAKIGIYGLTPQAMTTVYNLTNHNEEYSEIPQWVKDTNLVLIKGRNEDGNVDYYTFPKANSMQPFMNPMEEFLAYMAGNDTQTFQKFATNLISNTLPVVEGGSTLKEVGVHTIGKLFPQAGKPLAENLINKSFFKYDSNKEEAKEIVPYYLKDKAPGDQSYEFTPSAYKTIGKILNVSPLQVQNLAEGYFAGYAKVPVQVIDLMKKWSEGEKISPNDVTLVRRFVRETRPTGKSKKKQQAAETPLISQAGAAESIPSATPEPRPTSPNLDENGDVADDRNWFHKMFNITPRDEKVQQEESLAIPDNDEELSVVYKNAKSILDGYSEKKTKYQYGRYDDPESKLADLEEDRQYAEQILAQIEEKHPDKIANIELRAHVSGAGANVDERAEWAYNNIKKLAETGETDKVTEFINKLWDEKVLTGGSKGVAAKIKEEYGIDVYSYGSDPKKSKSPGSKGSSSSKKAAKETQKKVSAFFKKAATTRPKINTDIRLPKTKVNWAKTSTPAPVNTADAEFSTKVPVAPTVGMEKFFAPKAQNSFAEAQSLVNSVRGRKGGDSRLKLRYSG